MKARLTLATLLLLQLACFGAAADLQLSDGRVLKDYRIIETTPLYILVTHSQGAESVLISSCPPALQKELNYDPLAAEAELQAIEADREAKRREAAWKELEEFANSRPEDFLSQEEIEQRKRRLVGEVISVTEDGVLLMLTTDVEFETPNLRPAKKPVQPPDVVDPPTMAEARLFETAKLRWEAHLRRSELELERSQIVYLFAHPKQGQLFDGQFLDVYGLISGTYQYTAVSGADKRVKQFSYLSETPFLRTRR